MPLSFEQARKIVGNQSKPFVYNMATALSLLTWHNTEDDWRRLEAACVVLGRGAPKRAREVLALHKAGAR